MCGILATISKNAADLDQEKFKVALSKTKHRGPDGSEIGKAGEQGLFGFNWLSIQDLRTEAMQPFDYEGNKLTFNGEIYNFIELKADLEKKGYVFKTKSDTEVLAAGLTAEGVDFIKKINGIYGFVFYDAKSKHYLAVRDKFGVKPLFYFYEKGRVILSSEIKSILQYVPAILDKGILFTQLYMDWFVGNQKDKTYFKDIKSVEPGFYYIFDENGSMLKKEQYYVPDFKTEITKPVPEIEKEFKGLIEKAFEIECRSDVPIGMILSGGIDSSTILTMASPYLLKKQKKIPTFTYYFKDRGDDSDLQYTRKLINELEKRNGDVYERHEINLDPTITYEDYLQAAKAHETPVVDMRFIARLKNYKAVKDAGLKVCLNGQGSDEVFYGYYPLDYWLSIFYREGTFDKTNIVTYFAKLNELKLSGVTDGFRFASISETEKYLDKTFKEIGPQENQQKLLTAFLRQNMLPALIGAEDRFGMNYGIEVRVPAINPLLVEYGDKIDYKIHLLSTTSGRHLFRKAISDILPEEIVMRTKNPGPKKKKYQHELINIIKEHYDGILKSPLVTFVYKSEFIKNIVENVDSLNDQAFYGGVNDVLSEIIGLYAFEEVFSISV